MEVWAKQNERLARVQFSISPGNLFPGWLKQSHRAFVPAHPKEPKRSPRANGR
jgi:hypothetical protein